MMNIKNFAAGVIAALGIAGAALVGAGPASASPDLPQTIQNQPQPGDPAGRSSFDHTQPGQHHHGDHKAGRHHHGRG